MEKQKHLFPIVNVIWNLKWQLNYYKEEKRRDLSWDNILGEIQ